MELDGNDQKKKMIGGKKVVKQKGCETGRLCNTKVGKPKGWETKRLGNRKVGKQKGC